MRYECLTFFEGVAMGPFFLFSPPASKVPSFPPSLLPRLIPLSFATLSPCDCIVIEWEEEEEDDENVEEEEEEYWDDDDMELINFWLLLMIAYIYYMHNKVKRCNNEVIVSRYYIWL